MDLSNLLNKIDEIPATEKQCTQALLNEWKSTPPLLHKKVLINCHLTIGTLLLVELFVFSGAEISITCTEELVCHEPILEIIKELGIYLAPSTLTQEMYTHYFDAILDCGAYLNSMQPRNGFIELTFVEDSKYTSTDRPIISVDSGLIKQLETFYGTGDGFVRAIDQIYSSQNQNFRDKNYLVFGFGKVGQGICSCLVDAGVSKSNIIIVETCENTKNSALQKNYLWYSIRNDKSAIESLLQNHVHCAVTATGVSNSISNFLEPECFQNVEYLANMGTHDEWGHSFPVETILHDKRPLNFMLEYPTKICYLDPIFTVLACATLDIIDHGPEQQFTIMKPNITMEQKVFATWLKNNKVHTDVNELWLNKINSFV